MELPSHVTMEDVTVSVDEQMVRERLLPLMTVQSMQSLHTVARSQELSDDITRMLEVDGLFNGVPVQWQMCGTICLNQKVLGIILDCIVDREDGAWDNDLYWIFVRYATGGVLTIPNRALKSLNGYKVGDELIIAALLNG